MSRRPSPIKHDAYDTHERLQNVLARRGVASRRQAAELIASGRVTVGNQTILAPGWRVAPEKDEIRLDGQRLSITVEPHRTILMYKPCGVICSADNTQGKTVCDLVQHLPERLVPIGRLDKASEGVILLSNDGALNLRLTHPRHGHLKCYEVTVTGRLSPDVLTQLSAPLELDDYLTKPIIVKVLRSADNCHTLALTLSEGRNHQIKRLCGRAGLFVTHLLRTSVAGLTLAGLRPGEWRDLTSAEMAHLHINEP